MLIKKNVIVFSKKNAAVFLLTVLAAAVISCTESQTAPADNDEQSSISFSSISSSASSSSLTVSSLSVSSTSSIVSGTEILSNGNFSSGLSPWSFWVDPGASATGSVVGSEFSANVTVSSADWNVQLAYNTVSLEAGSSYQLSFSGRATTGAAKNVRVIFKTNGGANTWYRFQDFTLTSSMTVYSLTFQATVSDLAAQLQFALGADTGGAAFDNISLIKIGGSSSSASSISSISSSSSSVASSSSSAASSTPNSYFSGTIPNAEYIGRWQKRTVSSVQYDCSYYHAGGMIKVKFTGTTAKLNVPAWDNGVNFYWKIDNGPWGVNASSGSSATQVNLTPTPLSDGTHSLIIVGGNTGNSGLLNGNYIKAGTLVLDAGKQTLPPDISSKHIEFIGDSISTVGYGDTTPGAHWNYLIGAELGAEHSHIAKPGVSLSGMAAMYLNLYDSIATPWNFSLYQPNVIVINLGQNGGVNQAVYQTMLTNIRAKVPNAYILALALFSTGSAGNNPIIQAAVNAIGDPKIVYISQSAGLTGGGDVHPNEAQSRNIADVLKPVISPYLGM